MTDNMTPEQRSRTMSRIRGVDTGIERIFRSELHRRGLRFRKHVRDLPGKPDVVFPREKLAVFVDGDFWHGYRFPLWRDSLPPFWQSKIETNRMRDLRNFRRLRRSGWIVMRIWGHEVQKNLESAADRVMESVLLQRQSL